MPTTAQLEAYLAELYAARSKVLLRKNATISGRAVTSADEKWISDQIKETESKLYRRGGGDTSVRIVFDRGGR